MADFSVVVQCAEELRAQFGAGVELPRVDRSLGQILEAGQRLWARSSRQVTPGTTAHESAPVQAATLLGPKGFDVPRVMGKLDALSTATTLEPLAPVRDTDIQTFLKNERENALLTVIESTKKRTMADAESRHWEAMKLDWEKEKQRLLDHLLANNSSVPGGEKSLGMSTSHNSTLLAAGGRSSIQPSLGMGGVETAYARQVYMYNQSCLPGGASHGSQSMGIRARLDFSIGQSSLGDLIGEAVKEIDDQTCTNMWEVLREMASVPRSTRYTPSQARAQPEYQSAFVGKAKACLERRYLMYMEERVQSNLQLARLGGRPGRYQTVLSFLNVGGMPAPMGSVTDGPPVFENGTVDGKPVWALVYYCWRCGDYQASLSVLEKVPGLAEFADYMREYVNSADSRLNSTSSAALRLAYRKDARSSRDPFKRIMYCIVGGCDISQPHSEVAQITEDFLWVKLSLIQSTGGTCSGAKASGADLSVASANESAAGRSAAAGPGGEVLTLPQLQKQLLEEYGESHFVSPSEGPALYFFTLVLSGQFEACIELLSRYNGLLAHAVHMALVLYDRGVLCLPASVQAHILSVDPSDQAPSRRLNLARLVSTYTARFEGTNARDALHYFYFLRDLKAPDGENLFQRCVKTLVVESCEFDTLLGKMQPDGQRQAGAIDKFNVPFEKIVEAVAKELEQRGMSEQAVTLYDLAGNQTKAVGLCSTLLAQVVADPPRPTSAKDRINKLAVSMAQRYHQSGSVESRVATMGTFHLLLDLCHLFDLYHAKDRGEALGVLHRLKILPLELDHVEQKVTTFAHYPDEIRRCLPDILLIAMTMLYEEHYRFSQTAGSEHMRPSPSGGPDLGSSQSFLTRIREQAKSLITFAGMIPYRLPGDTYAQLVQLEVLMN